MFTPEALKTNHSKAFTLVEKLWKSDLKVYFYVNPTNNQRLTITHRYPKQSTGKLETLVRLTVGDSRHSYYGYSKGWGHNNKARASLVTPFQALQFGHGMFTDLNIDDTLDHSKLLETEGFILFDSIG